jgi:hypothetical protein
VSSISTSQCPTKLYSKSQIVIEYSYAWKEQHPTAHVIWIHASTREKLEQAYRAIARELRLPGCEDPSIDTLSLVVQWLSKEDVDPWLLILDNADDIEMFFGPVSRSQTDRPNSSFADLYPAIPWGLSSSRLGMQELANG